MNENQILLSPPNKGTKSRLVTDTSVHFGDKCVDDGIKCWRQTVRWLIFYACRAPTTQKCRQVLATTLPTNSVIQVAIQYDCNSFSNWINGILRNRSSNLSWMASLNFSYSCKVHVPNNQKLFNFCQIFTRHGSILAH